MGAAELGPAPGAEQAQPELSAGYYLDHFETVARWVTRHSGALLRGHDHAQLERFFACSLPARRLYVRLLSRRGPDFRLDRLSYPEIGDGAALLATANELADAGLAERDPPLDLEAAAALLTRAELRARALDAGLVESAAVPASLRKDALVARIGDALGGDATDGDDSDSDDSDDGQDVRARLGLSVVRARGHALLRRLCLLFFGNAYQGLEQLVLAELGVTRFEAVPLEPSATLFGSPEQVDDALVIAELQRWLWTERRPSLDALREARGALPPAVGATAASPALGRAGAGMLVELARAFERHGATDEALALYAQTERPPSRERQARIHEKAGDSARALRLVEAIAAAPVDESERTFAARFGRRLRGVPRLRRAPPPTIALRLRSDGRPPELLAADALAQRGFDAYYVENDLAQALFQLVLWDEIFAPGDGAFIQPYQRGPLDLFTETFRARRGAGIAATLDAFVADDEAPMALLARYREKRGVANALLRWARVDEGLIARALAQIPRAHIAAILRRMTFDLAHNRSGLPDLALFGRSGAPGDYQLVEVKAGSDRLSDSQRAWLSYFGEVGIPHAVARVTWRT